MSSSSRKGSRRALITLLVATALVLSSLSATTTASVAVASVAPSGSPSLQDATGAPDEVTAGAIAAKFGHSVLVDADTTQTIQIKALPDGSMQMVQNMLPVRIKQGGSWTAVSTTLGTSTDGTVSPAAVAVGMKFSGGGDGPLAQVETSTGEWISEAWPYGELPNPILSGATATYANVLPDVDLTLTASVTGMSEVLVVKNASAAADPRLASVDLSIGASSLSTVAGHRSVASASDGSTLTADEPNWWDSSNPSADASGPAPGDFAKPLAHDTTDDSLALDVGSAVSDDVTYPMYIDPDWTGGVNNRWFIDQGYPNTSFLNPSNRLKLGYASAALSTDGVNHLARMFWQVDTSGVEGKHILAAHFDTTETYSGSCTPMTVELWWMGAVNPGSTWNNTPNAWTSEMDSQTVAYGRPGTCPQNAVGFNALQGVQSNAASNAPWLGLGMKASAESDSRSYKEFSPSASITITYNSIPNNPTNPRMTSPARTCSTDSTHPTFINNAVQPLTLAIDESDADAGGLVNAAFVVVTGAHAASDSAHTLASAPPAIVSWGTPMQAQGTLSVQVPQGALATAGLTENTVYAWHAYAGDSIDLAPNYSSYCYFQFKNSIPSSPTVTSTGTAVVGQPMTVTISSTTADHAAVFGYWWVPGTAAATPPAPPVTTAGSTSAALPSCGSNAGAERFDCPTTGGSASIAVAPVDSPYSTLWVIEYDAAGNVSMPISLQVSAAADSTNVSYSSGHGWVFEGLSSPLPFSLSDSNASTPMPLTIGSGIDETQTDTVNGFPGVPVLTFSTASSSQALASSAAVSTNQSFTVSAWVKPSGLASSSSTGTIVSEGTTASHDDAFTLSVAGGHLSFCVSNSPPAPKVYCATSTSTISDGQWMFVTGILDVVNKQVRLLVGDQLTPIASAARPAPHSSAADNGPLVVGSVTNHGGPADQWSGAIDDPTIFPGVVDFAQLDNLFFQSAP